jgi:hypothetical protein
MTTTVETITPEKATEYLNTINRQRPLRLKTAKSYAEDMGAGHWLLTHQGIAFDDRGCLIDGQHRLRAVILAGKPVEFMVTRQVPATPQNGIVSFTMDSFDRGIRRTVGDQLEMTNVKGGKSVAACCSAIAFSQTNEHRSLTTAQTREVYLQFGKEVDHVLLKRSREHGIRTASVIGAVAFAMKTHPDKMIEFYDLLVRNEGLWSTGVTNPVYRLRQMLGLGITAGDGWACRSRTIRGTLNACHAFAEGRGLEKIVYDLTGQNFFIQSL